MTDAGTAPASLSTDLKRRVPSAIALGLLALGATWYGGFPFLLFWVIAASGVWYEWASLVRAEPRTTVLAFGAVLIIGAAVLFGVKLYLPALGVVFAGAIVVAVLTRATANGKAWSSAGIFYAIAVFGPIVLLRADPILGMWAVIWIYAVVWLTDIAGYFCGKFIGGPKLAPAISPKKTWSGAIGGALFGIIGGLVVVKLAGFEIKAAHALVALAVSLFAQAGDIFESSIKRKFDKKDSSGLIPGHGGLMDRLDGFIAAALLAGIIALVRSGSMEPASGLLQW